MNGAAPDGRYGRRRRIEPEVVIAALVLIALAVAVVVGLAVL